MIQRGLSYGPLDEHRLDFYAADAPADAPLFVFFHGGGLEGGDRGRGDDPVFTELARQGISTATADYRLYPKARFPEFIEDAALAVSWCLSNLPHSRLFVGGSSAGGYLSMMLALDARFLAAHGIDAQDRRQIGGYFCDAGQPTVHYNVLRERGLDTRLVRVDEAAPVYHVKPQSDPQKLPLIALVVADGDMVNRLEQNRLLYRTLLHLGWREDGVSFTLMKGFGHTQYQYARSEDGEFLYVPMVKKFISDAR